MKRSVALAMASLLLAASLLAQTTPKGHAKKDAKPEAKKESGRKPAAVAD